MLQNLNWPTALVMVVGTFVVGGCVYTGHHLPAAVVASFWALVLGAMPALFRKLTGGAS